MEALCLNLSLVQYPLTDTSISQNAAATHSVKTGASISAKPQALHTPTFNRVTRPLTCSVTCGGCRGLVEYYLSDRHRGVKPTTSWQLWWDWKANNSLEQLHCTVKKHRHLTFSTRPWGNPACHQIMQDSGVEGLLIWFISVQTQVSIKGALGKHDDPHYSCKLIWHGSNADLDLKLTGITLFTAINDPLRSLYILIWHWIHAFIFIKYDI